MAIFNSYVSHYQRVIQCETQPVTMPLSTFSKLYSQLSKNEKNPRLPIAEWLVVDLPLWNIIGIYTVNNG
jgi:hypothetical protein